jgi:integrase
MRSYSYALSTDYYGQDSQHKQEQEHLQRIYDVTEGLKSDRIKQAYLLAFEHFLKTTAKGNDRRALLDTKQNVIESKIIDHINFLKDVQRLSYSSIQVHLMGIFHFFEINDFNLNTKKIKRFMPEDESDHYARDRPYSVTEIEQILSKCDLRCRVAVLLMTSSGLRIGGLRELQIGDIKKIDEFNLHIIWVYNRSRKDRYYTFCSPECSAVIDEYLLYRQKCGEQLKDKSPLIRDNFDIDNPFTAQAPNFISRRGMFLLFEEALNRAKVNPIVPGQKKRAVACSHGFRKFFITQCDKAHLDYTTWKYLAGHKLPRIDASYIRTTEEDRLAEYIKAVPLLTISPEHRLKTRIQQLESQQTEEIDRLKAQLQGYKDEQARVQDVSMESIRVKKASRCN